MKNINDLGLFDDHFLMERLTKCPFLDKLFHNYSMPVVCSIHQSSPSVFILKGISKNSLLIYMPDY